MRTFSFGAGVQSTAVLVLQAEGRLPEPYDAFLFANVGDDSEHPATLAYYREVHVPYAEENGIHLEEVRKVRRDGTTPTIYQNLIDLPDARGAGIPVYMSNGAPGRRSCTGDFKIQVIHKWQRQNRSSKENPATCGLGISMDEIQRARTDSGFPDQILEYPLLDHKPPLRRADCYKIIEEAGLPKPPRSACWFCPFHSKEAWRELKRETPDLFQKAVELEATINVKRARLFATKDWDKDPNVWLTKHLRPLDQVVDDQLVLDLDGPDGCDSGSCFT